MEIDQFNRTRLLFGEEALEKFGQTRIAVMGLGGVGSYAAECLARSGIKKLLLVDFDKVSRSNINRQLLALHSTIGRQKTDLMKERLLDINPEMEIDCFVGFCNEHSRPELLKDVDYVIDAIDSLVPKVGLLEDCWRKGIPVISVMGAASRFDPSLVELSDISKTDVCPLARRVRKFLRRRGIKKGIPAIFSRENPIPQYPPEAGTIQDWEGDKGRMRGTLGSSSYLPAIMGLWAAGWCLRKISGK